MTKEENIATLNEHLTHWKRLLSEKICDQDEGEKTIDALQNAIKSLEQEPCDDCVSRQAVNELVDELARAISDERCCISRGRNTATIMRDILLLPPVSAQPKMGRWIGDAIQGEIDGQIVKGFTCSKCSAISLFRMIGGKIVNGDLCPNCGAKMQEVEND